MTGKAMRTGDWRVVAVGAVIALGTGGCDVGWRGEAGGEAPALVVDTLDSGRVVVHSHDPVRTDDEAWHLDRMARIPWGGGSLDPAPGRIVDVAFDSEGRVVIVDGDRAEVRAFSTGGGAPETLIGPRGDTLPLEAPYAIALDPRGRLWVGDAASRTYLTFEANGLFVGAMPSPLLRGHLEGQLRISGTRLFDIGFLMSRGRVRDPADSMAALGPGVVAFALDRALAPSDTLALAGEPPGRAPPLAARWVADVGPRGEIWVGHGARSVMHQLDLRGDTVRTVRWDSAPLRLDSVDVAEQEGWLVNQSDEAATIDPVSLPLEYPHFERIVAAEDGSVWLYRRTSSSSGRFEVFDADGRHIGAVETDLEAGFEGVHPFITRDRLVGVALDAAGEPSVVVDRIVRPPTGVATGGGS